ncbi:hypothetical protein HUU53_02695 [Candidatus Micrarchaeota archaeon]|nr:hypothetical protein [Candidatus Micrarchaeota archaeon]
MANHKIISVSLVGIIFFLATLFFLELSGENYSKKEILISWLPGMFAGGATLIIGWIIEAKPIN